MDVSDNSKELMEQLEAQLDAYKKNMRSQVFNALTRLESEILAQIRGKSGLVVRTGALLNSIGASKKVEEVGGNIVGSIGPEGIPYAAIQEFGGTVVPKNKQFLAIPTSENRRADGLPIMTTTELQNTGKSFVRDGLIYLEEGKKITPMFILKRSVTIPAHHYLANSIANTQDAIMKDFGLFLAMSFPSNSSSSGGET